MSSSGKPLYFSEMKLASLRRAVCALARFGRDFSLARLVLFPFRAIMSPDRSARSDDLLLAGYCAFHVGADLIPRVRWTPSDCP